MAGQGAHVPEASASDTWLVWCFEHIEKQEHAQILEEMRNLANMFGFHFLCFRKGRTFLSWLDATSGSVLLVAEWREAKPIIQAIGRRTEHREVAICAVARSDSTCRRARAWLDSQSVSSQGLGMAKYITVSPGLCLRNVEELIATYLETLGPVLEGFLYNQKNPESQIFLFCPSEARIASRRNLTTTLRPLPAVITQTGFLGHIVRLSL